MMTRQRTAIGAGCGKHAVAVETLAPKKTIEQRRAILASATSDYLRIGNQNMLTPGVLDIVSVLVAVAIFIVIAMIITGNESLPASGKYNRLLLVFIICFLAVVWWLVTPDYEKRGAFVAVPFLIAPPVFTILGAFMLQRGLQKPTIRVPLVISSLVPLASTSWWLGETASLDVTGAIIAILGGVCAGAVGLVLAGWLFVSLRRRRKVAALLMAVAFPISLIFGIQQGDSRSPESVTKRNGDQIVRALNEYHLNESSYPPTLTDLVPKYLPAVPEALTTQKTGWLYTHTDGDFTLGYWMWPEKMGAQVCLFSPGDPRWECEWNHWGPFRAVPTPGR